MDDKLKKVLQEENHAVSSESKSPESAEQEGVIQKSIDVGTCKMDAEQDSSKPLMKNPLHRPVSIDSVIVLNGGTPAITLRIENRFSREVHYVVVNLEDLTVSTLRKCAMKNGGMVNDWKRLFDTLMHEIKLYDKYDHVKIVHGHTRLGWDKQANGIVFYHQDMISSDEESSKYMGELDIEQKGSLDNIVEMIEKWILSTQEWSPLEAVLAFSAAAIVLPFANLVFGKNMNNLVLHLVGNSTTGKSTSLRLHLALASNPYNERYGFWLNHQSSLASIIRRIGENHGISISIDELSSASKNDYTNFIYALGNGEEKDRLKAGGTALSNSAKFSTIILSSGEVSVLEKSANNEGVRARCAEFRNVEWTESKEQADEIHHCLRENYGWVAPLVAKELLNNSDSWKTKWDQIYRQVNSQMDKEKIHLSIGSRMSEFVTLFAIAAEIINKILGINLNVDKIYDFCYLHLIRENADEGNLGERAYEYLLRYACEHPDEFSDDVNCETMIGSYYSKEKIKGLFRQTWNTQTINGKEYRLQLVFFENTFKDILKEGGFPPVGVVDELHKAGLLLEEAGRHTYRITYNDIRLKCYVLWCNREDEMMYKAWADGTYNPFGKEDYQG